MNNKSNFDIIQDSFSSFSLLEAEDDSDFLEWCSMEGSERISELSRQIRTFFNYKNIIIHLRYSRSKNEPNYNVTAIVKKQENDLTTLFFQYTPLMDIIGADERNFDDKIRNLMQKIIELPKNYEKDLLKKIKELGSKLWMKIHTLSELELHHYPRLLIAVVKISKILCSAESVFFWPFSCFYLELSRNYSQLEKEISSLIPSNEKVGIKMRESKNKLRVIE